MDTIIYVAKQGDYLVKIAQEHGTTWQAIWNHPLNAEHRRKRGSPDVLCVGDVLHVPSASTGQPAPSPQPSGPPVVSSVPPPWPYPAAPTPVVPTMPTWECPGGICVCHGNEDSDLPVEHSIYLFDELNNRMPNARCRIHSRGQLIFDDRADAGACARVLLSHGVDTVFVEWAPEATPLEPPYPFRKHYIVKHPDDAAGGLQSRLVNAGFDYDRSWVDRYAAFKYAYIASDQPATGTLSEIAPLLGPYHDGPPPLLPPLGIGAPPPPPGLMALGSLPTAGVLAARGRARIKMPSFRALWEAHPGHGQFGCNKNLGLQCAMKLGHAIYQVDPLILSLWSNGPTCGVPGHMYHITSPLSLITYLGSPRVLGPAEYYQGGPGLQDKVAGRQGIIYFEWVDPDHPRVDHIDLWTDPPMDVAGQNWKSNTRLGAYFRCKKMIFIQISVP